jgi:hypothetical protein
MLKTNVNELNIKSVMLTCTLGAHDKLSKIKNLIFNDRKYLMFRKLNAQVSMRYYHIYLVNMCLKGTC